MNTRTNILNGILVLVMSACTALITGCESTPVIPAELRYSEPSLGSPSATISGFKHTGSLLANAKLSIVSVDSKRIIRNGDTTQTAYRVQPGIRIIEAEYERGDLKAWSKLEFTAEEGHSYCLQYSDDSGLLKAAKTVDFWIIDIDTKSPVTEVSRGSTFGTGAGGFLSDILPVK